MKTVVRSLLSLVLGITFTSAALADNWHAIDRAALLMEGQTQSVAREIQISLRRSASYPALVSKAGQLQSHASQLHGLVHAHASRQQLDRVLHCMDDIYADMADCLFDAGREARYDRHCQVDTRRAEQLLKCVDNSIHQLERLVDGLRDCDYHPVLQVPRQPVITNQYRYQGPDYGDDDDYRSSFRPNYDTRPSYGSSFNGSNSPRPGVSFGRNGVTLGNGLSISFGR